jgi:hypothetical protein
MRILSSNGSQKYISEGKYGGKIVPSYFLLSAKLSTFWMKYCTVLYLGTPRKKNEKEKSKRVTKIGFTIYLNISSYIYFKSV